jgi:asparagine synthase (glutamine-hydrolysing)
MSRITGVYYFDGRPIGREDQALVLSALGAINPALIQLRLAEGILMGSARPATVGSSESGAHVGDICAWDGRLDNRETVSRCIPAQSGDGAAALALYQARGVDGLGGLIGDWSLAIWDAGRRMIVLASDYAGIRPLYYYRDSHCLLWSTSLQCLAKRAASGGLDEEYVASFLRQGNAAYRTPYRGIFPVPPGQAVLVNADGVRTQAFWSLPFHQQVRFMDPRDYEVRLRTLFEEAVKVRLAGPRHDHSLTVVAQKAGVDSRQVSEPSASASGACDEVRLDAQTVTCAELSGGLDSSSVVCMASRILASQEAGAARLVTFSYQSADSSDTRYIRAVERAIQNPGIHLDLKEFPFLTAEQPGIGMPAGWGARFDEVARRMESIGSKVLLTGQLGDFLMGGLYDDAEQVVDHMERGRMVAAMREAFAWSRYLRVPVYSILWRALKTTFSLWNASIAPTALSSVHNPYAGADSLATAFRKRVDLREIERIRALRWKDAAPSQRRRFRILSETLESRSLQTPEPMQDFSFTHPFSHRPLVEFMLTIPAGQVCRPGEPRRLMRRALSDVLPPAIAARKTKASYSKNYRESLVPLAKELLRRPAEIRLVEMGYLDGRSVTDRLERMTEGLLCNESQLRHVILLEFWLRARERGAVEAPDIEIGDIHAIDQQDQTHYTPAK